MAATTAPRLTATKGPIPQKGTYPMPANTLLLRGTIGQLNSDGRIVANDVTTAANAVGKVSQNYDNRTGSAAGGANDSLEAEVEYGVFGWKGEDGHLPKVGDVCYVADNQTVSTDGDIDDGTGLPVRGIAGYCVEVRDGQYWVWMGPHVAAQITIGASLEASLIATAALAEANETAIGLLETAVGTAEGTIVELETAVADIRTDAAVGFLPIPLATFTTVSTGAPLVVYVDGTNGLEFAEGDGQCYRFNDDEFDAIGACVALPPDLDHTKDVVVHALVSRVGAEDVTVTLDVGAFFQTVDAAVDADDDAGGSTAAIDGTTLLLAERTVTIDAADVPAAPCALTLTLAPSSALEDDDLRVHAVWLEYTKAVTVTP